MFASRPAGRISASDVHCESELEGFPGSDPDRRRFLEVGGRVTAVDVEKVNGWDVASRGESWTGGGETGSWTSGCLGSRVSSLKRWGMGSEPLGAGTGLPDESVYVQSLDAKKLGNRKDGRQRVRIVVQAGGWSPIATWSWLAGGCSSMQVFSNRGEGGVPVPSHRRLLLWQASQAWRERD